MPRDHLHTDRWYRPSLAGETKMKYLLVIFTFTTFGCQHDYDSKTPKSIPHSAGEVHQEVAPKDKEDENKNLSDNQQKKREGGNIANIFRVDLGEKNWVEFSLFQTRANIKAYVPEFERGAEAFLSLNFKEEISTLKRFQDICHEKSYETNRDFNGLPGHLLFSANPLHWAFFQTHASYIIKMPITEVENPFIISRKEIEVHADFLSDKEKTLLKDSGILVYFDNLDNLRLNLFNPLIDPNEYLSSILARLVCGIAHKKASIKYTFYNKETSAMKVSLNRIDF